MDAGNGHRQLRQKSEPDVDDDKEKSEDRQRFAWRQMGEKGFEGAEDSWREARQKYCQEGEAKGGAKEKPERRRHTRPQHANEVTHQTCESSRCGCGTSVIG